MIRKVVIKNFKSIPELELELGRFNIFIGANGSGKSNILEAIAFAGAAAADKLDNEFLSSRGIRRTEPNLMRSAFDNTNGLKEIAIDYYDNGDFWKYLLSNDNQTYSNWERKVETNINHDVKGEFIKAAANILNRKASTIANYLVYSPIESSLRKFEEEGPILPLGRNGEGLFKLLTVMKEDGSLTELKEHLSLLDWYENFEIGNGNFASERFLEIKDRFLDKDLKYFDQRSANEGFLFLLFYLALFISKDTPNFFAIENIENSLNPKLCRELMIVLTKLAAEHDKQTIITTHNPGILDGINLHDDEQRLFVVERNLFGHTKVHRIKMKEGKAIGIKLSEAFMSGFLGGLPNNF